MKSAKKISKFLVLFLSVVVALIFIIGVGGVLTVIERPQWVFTPKNLEWAAKKARARGIEVSWDKIEIHAATPNFLRPELAFRWTDLHVHKKGTSAELQLEGDFKELAIAAQLDFRKFPPRLKTVGPIDISANQLSVTPGTPATTAPKQETPSTPFQIPSALQSTQIEPIHVDVDHWKIAQANGDLEGSLHMVYDGKADKTSDHTLHGDVVVLGSKPVSMHLIARVNSDAGTGGRGQPTDIQAELTGSVGGIAPQIKSLQLNSCRLHLILQDSSRDPAGELQTDCPVEVVAETMQFKQFPQVTFENKLGLKLTGDFRTEDYSDQKKPVHAQARLDLTPYYPLGKARQGFKSWGSLSLEGDAIPAKPVEEWQIHSKLEVELAVAEFQDLVKILDKTAYAVPAPFHVFRGGIQFVAKGDVTAKGGEIPLELHTQLHSTRPAPNASGQPPQPGQAKRVMEQSLVLDSKGNLKFKKEKGYDIDLRLETMLTDIQLALPHFDLSSFPKLTPDTRIREEIEAVNKSGPNQFHYQIHVHTTEKPVRIVTNLASGSIPIRVDVQLDDGKPPLGKLNIEKFPVDVFKRKATIEKFDLTLEPKKMPIQGEVQVVYTDYTVNILIKGTISDPVYQFTSEPALSEQDVISVLLFGKSSDDLDSDQSDSVGSVRSAAADKSLNLASLYLLAATPIESVGYDPANGSVTAKVKIADGTSLNVAGGGAGNNGLQTVGIRKRLGSNFSITTEVTSSQLDQSGSLAGASTTNNQRSVSALLEWRHRY